MVRKNWTFVSDYYEDEWDTPIRTYIAQIDTQFKNYKQIFFSE